MLLTCCFAGGIVLRLCDEEGAWSDLTCENVFGLDSSYSASAFVVALSYAMLGLFLIAIIGNTALAVRRPIIRLAATGHPPVLDLPAELHFHIFLSHVWSTGQDQAETNLSAPPPCPPAPPCCRTESCTAQIDPCTRAAPSAAATRCSHLARRRQFGEDQRLGGGRGEHSGCDPFSLRGVFRQ